MQLRSRAFVGLLTLVLALPAVVATAIVPAAAAGVPHIDSVSPDNAYFGYSFPITISGSNLTGTTSVHFNSRAASSVVVVDDSTVTAMTPGLGAFSSPTTLTVTSPGGTSNAIPFTFTFTPPAPVVTAITPSSGQFTGGDAIAITGDYVNSGTSVTFGGVAATVFAGNGSGEIDVFSPPHAAGDVDVVVTTDGGPTTVTNGFFYMGVPTVTGVSTSAGAVGGGTSVTIAGTAFTGATAVDFGTTAATSFTVDSSTSITATAPAHTAGVVHVTVTVPDGTSSTSSVDAFTYRAAPTISDISPALGPAAGGTTVTVTGTDLTGTTSVRFGAAPATSFTVDSATSITATSPAHAAGPVDVTIMTPFGDSPASTPDEFTYAAPAPPAPSSACCRFVSGDGEMFAAGNSHMYGSLRGQHLGAPVVALASTPSGDGYWLAASDGGVFAFGDARYAGSMSGRHLNAPIVAITATPDGAGYWLAASDGGVFAFGDARYAGSMSGRHLNGPIVGISSGTTGYLLAARDGGVFAFDDARFAGSAANRHLNAPIVGVAATSAGYLLVGRDGGVFAFGGATMLGSLGGRTNGRTIVGIHAADNGYLIASSDGMRFSFTANARGVASSTAVDAPIIAIG